MSGIQLQYFTINIPNKGTVEQVINLIETNDYSLF